MPTTIKCNFYANFITSDNIQHNLESLDKLYDLWDEHNLLIKPKIVIIGSIIEASLFDFVYRIKTHTKEFKALPEEKLRYVRALGKNHARHAEKLADICTNGLILSSDSKFWDDVTKIRYLRNRTHIQNEKGHLPKHENEAFTEMELNRAEAVIIKFFRYMQETYPRPEKNIPLVDFIFSNRLIGKH